MSIIVTRGGVMAADGLMVDGDYWEIVTLEAQKIFRVPDGSLVGCVGSTSVIQNFRSILSTDRERANRYAADMFGNSKTSALRLMPDGSLRCYDGGGETKYPLSLRYHAIGAGSSAALGAMDMGASARKACAIAINRNMGARGRVQWLKLGKACR